MKFFAAKNGATFFPRKIPTLLLDYQLALQPFLLKWNGRGGPGVFSNVQGMGMGGGGGLLNFMGGQVGLWGKK